MSTGVMVAFVAAFAFLIALATAASPHPVVAERLPGSAPLGFANLGPAPLDSTVSFRLHLHTQRSPAELHSILETVSATGKHLEYPEVAELYAPPAAALDRVLQWLVHEGVDLDVDVIVRMEVVLVRASVRTVNRLFNTAMHEFVSLHDQAELGRAAVVQRAAGSSVHLPEHVAGDVALVTGVSEMFHLQHPARRQAGVHVRGAAPRASSSAPLITPDFLRSYYGVAYTPAANSKAKTCVGSFGSYYNPTCLAQFGSQIDHSSHGHIAKSIGYNCWGVDTNANCAAAEGEADLDVEYLTSMGDGVETWVWQSASNETDGQEWLLNWAFQVVGQTAANLDVPQVYSLSYGLPELWNCYQPFELSRYCPSFGYDSAKYVAAVDSELQRMGMRGWTVVVATGDDGAAGDTSNAPYATGYGVDVVNQLAVTLDGGAGVGNITCAIPFGGMGRGFLCGLVMQACGNSLHTFVSSFANGYEGCSLETQSVFGPSCVQTQQPSVSSNCSRSQFPSVSYSVNGGAVCTIGAYDVSTAQGGQGVDLPLLANYPGSSPYIVAVGATMVGPDGKSEVTCSSGAGALISSGGYFSPLHPRPSFQDDDVKSYLGKSGLPPASAFAIGGRAVPDIALFGHNYLTEMFNMATGSCGNVPGVDGTSASTPVFSGLVGLINDARLAAGKGTLGWLTPKLYSIDRSAFFDVTQGDNRCRQVTSAMTYDNTCATPPGTFWVGCGDWGFPATDGWDAATGLGSPHFPALLQQLVALP